jgi:outer membrane protein TolC
VLSSDWQGGSALPGPRGGQESLARAGVVGQESLATAFRSDALAGLIARAIAANADIAIARTRIDQARAQLRIARASMLPVVSASAGLSANRSDARDGPPFDFSDAFAEARRLLRSRPVRRSAAPSAAPP